MSQIQIIPENIGDHFFEVRQYNSDKVNFISLPLKQTTSQPITIGRVHQNNIQINNNTVSKHHAKITTIRNKHYLFDLDSVNGTFMNGNKLKPNQESGTALNNGDSIQFGKYECLYLYRDKTKNARSKSRGKINLKDYMFDEAKNSPKSSKERHINEQVQSETKSKRKVKGKGKIKEGRIKIPDITNFLQLQVQSKEPEPESQQKSQISEVRMEKKKKVVKKEGKIKLPTVDDFFSVDEQKNIDLHEKERNIFLMEEKSRHERKEKQKKMKEEQLQMQIQKQRQSEDLLQRQLIIEQKLREEKDKIEEDRRKLEEEFVRKQQEKRQIQMKKIAELQEKEKELVFRLEKQREKQLEDIKRKEEEIKEESENQYRNQYEKRKKELEIEAQALARQYQNIYRETIKKVRTQIEFQENGIDKLEDQIQKINKENQNLISEREQLTENLEHLKKDLMLISGRNRACILYASEIQNKIDALKENKKQSEGNGYYQPRMGERAKSLRESVINSRKLLKIKKKQREALWSEILAIKGSLNSFDSYSDIQEYVETIFENTKMIEKLKQEYLEYFEVQRALEDIWQAQLEENNQFEERNRLYQSQMKKNAQQIDENTRDQLKKSTEQRLHMLKIIHLCSEKKKSASKFLIEQMLTIQQEIHKFLIENQEIHKKIVDLVTKTEKHKRQNEYISEILFGYDQNAHHFDNMKFVINNLISKIEVEKNEGDVSTCLKLNNEGLKQELNIHEETQRRKRIKEGMRKVNELGLAPVQIKQNEKNPLIFFGDLLTQKKIQIDSRNRTISHLESGINKQKEEIRLLEEKRKQISVNLEKFKTEQLRNAKKYIQP